MVLNEYSSVDGMSFLGIQQRRQAGPAGKPDPARR
jgi:hypothetical protein